MEPTQFSWKQHCSNKKLKIQTNTNVLWSDPASLNNKEMYSICQYFVDPKLSIKGKLSGFHLFIVMRKYTLLSDFTNNYQKSNEKKKKDHFNLHGNIVYLKHF